MPNGIQNVPRIFECILHILLKTVHLVIKSNYVLELEHIPPPAYNVNILYHGIISLFIYFTSHQVRATNLQELVYKNGQAGVTKATVSITFDNSDKKQSPLGYEQYDEIVVTRQVQSSNTLT